jgi:hypothetical protein
MELLPRLVFRLVLRLILGASEQFNSFGYDPVDDLVRISTGSRGVLLVDRPVFIVLVRLFSFSLESRKFRPTLKKISYDLDDDDGAYWYDSFTWYSVDDDDYKDDDAALALMLEQYYLCRSLVPRGFRELFARLCDIYAVPGRPQVLFGCTFAPSCPDTLLDHDIAYLSRNRVFVFFGAVFDAQVVSEEVVKVVNRDDLLSAMKA